MFCAFCAFCALYASKYTPRFVKEKDVNGLYLLVHLHYFTRLPATKRGVEPNCCPKGPRIPLGYQPYSDGHQRRQRVSSHSSTVSLVFLILIKLRKKLFSTIWTKAVAELCLGMIPNVNRDILPVAFVITYLFTRCTYGQQAAQYFYSTKCVFQFRYIQTDPPALPTRDWEILRYL